MDYFKKRLLFLILTVALTTVGSYASGDLSSDASVSSSQEISQEEISFTETNSIEDEFASLYEERTSNTTAENTTQELQNFNNLEENTKNISHHNIATTEDHSKKSQSNIYEILLLILSTLLIITCSVFFYIKAKNRLTEIAGEHFEIEIEKDKEKKNKKEDKNKKFKKIKDTVNTLDKIYSKTAVRQPYTPIKQSVEIKDKEIQTSEKENIKIVNLDEILNKNSLNQTETIDSENQALEDFLSGFSYYEEEEFTPEIEPIFDENFLQEVINSNDITFQKQDIECMNKLLRLELNDEIYSNTNEFLMSNPIKIDPKEQVLERLVSDYAINKNITFTDDDFVAIRKLMNVELDRDFVTDLRTNPELTKRMQKEMEEFNKETKKPSKIKTLKVKDLLPDLSEALIKQGGKRIESNYRPETVYYQKGYDVSIMSVGDYLPNLTEEINKENSSEVKETSEYNLLDENFEITTLDTPSNLPDLSKEINSPSKNFIPQNRVATPNPKKLLKNLNNVKFKDIDEKRNFEIVNKDLQQTKKDESIKDTLSRKLTEIKTEKNLTEDKSLTHKLKNLKENSLTENVSENSKCVIGNEAYKIIQSISLKDNIGCYLAKNDKGYYLLSFVGDKVSHLKHFKELNIERLQARLTDKLDGDKLRFIIRVGLSNKILIDVENNTINYVMDL